MNPAPLLAAATATSLSVVRSRARALTVQVFIVAFLASRQSTGVSFSSGGSPTTITRAEAPPSLCTAASTPGTAALGRVFDHFAATIETSGRRDRACFIAQWNQS